MMLMEVVESYCDTGRSQNKNITLTRVPRAYILGFSQGPHVIAINQSCYCRIFLITSTVRPINQIDMQIRI